MNAYNTHGFQTATTRLRGAIGYSTRGGGAIVKARPGEALTLEEIAAKVPAIFADEAHESRSARYVYQDTRALLQGFINEGFRIMEARQGGSRIVGKKAFTKHAIRLEAPQNWAIETAAGDRTVPQVAVVGSHDGTSSTQLRSGLYRFLCLNGMVMGDDFEDFRVGHVSGSQDKIIEAAYRVVEDFPRAIDQARHMAGLQLSTGEQLAFAAAARVLRWEPQVVEGETAAKLPPVEPSQLLQVRRAGDAGGDLWRVTNRVQEALIRGGQHYRAKAGEPDRHGRQAYQNRTVGAVNSIDEDTKINRALMTLAAEMAKLKAA
jgi:hypothetical protein